MSGFNENDIVYLPIEPGQTVDNFRPFIVGTRKVIKLNYSEYSVVCATCGGGGNTPYRSRIEAIRTAISLSGHPCKCKGCGAT